MPSLHRSHFSSDYIYPYISYIHFLSPYNSSSFLSLIYSLSCHHTLASIAKSYFHAVLWHYTQLHITFEQVFVNFHRFSLISCPFCKAQNYHQSLKTIVSTLHSCGLYCIHPSDAKFFFFIFPCFFLFFLF